MKYAKILLVILLTNLLGQTYGQATKVRGNITDAVTKQPMPFVAIALKGTSIGVISDFDGNYYLETRSQKDTLKVTCLGYRTQFIHIKKGTYQNLNIVMAPNEFAIKEVVVKPGENPAHRILRLINDNKEKNSPEQFNAYQYELYNKIEFDVNNIGDEYKKKKLFKHFQFIFDYVDTSAETGKTYLPMFISEAMSDYYYRKSPKVEKEIIKANKISGWENPTISQFTGDMYQKVNVYSNYINIFGKNFVSPISNNALLFYKYYLLDSTFIDNHRCYHISFKPRRKQELTFTGDFWVNDTTFAIKKIKVRIADDANINYVKDLVATQEFAKVDNKHWFLKKDELFVDFNLGDSLTGFFARKSAIYNNIQINKPKEEAFYSQLGFENIKVLDDASKKSDEFWNQSRPDSLSLREKNIYKMIDTIQEVPIFKTYVDVVNVILFGYKPWGKFEIGPYPKLYSYNEVEGHRFRLGGRTNLKFSDKNFFEAYIAYGLRDQGIKYGVSFYQFLTKTKSSYWGATYKDDLEQFGKDPNTLISTDNILGTIFARSQILKLNRVREFTTYFDNEWFMGLSNRFTWRHRTIYTYQGDTVSIFEQLPLPKILTSEFTIKTRFAYKEQFIIGERSRTSIGTKWPIVQFNYTLGNYRKQTSPMDVGSLFDGYYYHKMNFGIEDEVYINPIGYSEYSLKAGKTFGRLPFHLLELHEGNETYWYNEAYNLMNYYEFVSDQYLSLKLTHHFEGLILNKVPLFRKLKLREVAFANGVIGSLSDRNKQANINELHNSTNSKEMYYLTKPYCEAGIGIENIFKIVRLDAIWRLSYLDHPNISKFGIRAKLQLVF
jgi:hypothetical protein